VKVLRREIKRSAIESEIAEVQAKRILVLKKNGDALKVRHRILYEVSVSVSDLNLITKDTIRIRKVSYKKIKITILIRKYPSDTIGQCRIVSDSDSFS
jgi:hypothetical protein